MYIYIDTLLSYKYKEYGNKKGVNRIETKEILNSCIIFVSQKNNMENITYSNKRSIFEVEEI